MRLEEAIEDFLVAVQSDGRQPLTVGLFRRILKPFRTTFQGQTLGEISTAMIRQFIVGLRHRRSRYSSGQGTRPQIEGGLSEDTIATHIRAVHRFWNWSAKEYQLTSNPMANIRRPPRIHPDPKGFYWKM
jgi:site-specific recombinase XerD